jgi:hypothetical protein
MAGTRPLGISTVASATRRHAVNCGGRDTGWTGSHGASRICLPAGRCFRDMAGQWEPDESRGSRPVLRERRGEIPLRHSPCHHLRARAGRAASLDVLSKRLAKYGLTLHPEKTRLIDFKRPDRRVSASPEGNGDAGSRPDSFDLGLHPLLGYVPQGILGGEAEDCRRPPSARAQAHRGVVPAIPA